MRISPTISLFMIALIHGLTATTASAQQQTAIPQAPPGFLWFEEENWYLLADEPGLHVSRAREAFLSLDTRKAATELRKAGVHLRIAANDATNHTKRDLKHAQHELEKTAQRIEEGTLKSVDEFDFATIRAMHALSEYQYRKAAEAWRNREHQQAGHYLRAAADNIERAAAKTDHRMKELTAQVAHESRQISGSLIEGTGYLVDDVGVGFEKMGHQIERVGARVAAVFPK